MTPAHAREITALADPRPHQPTIAPLAALRLRTVDPRILARAKAALQALSGEFSGWMEEEIGKLEAARAGLHAEPGAPVAWDELRVRAHDLKGLGTTFGHPLASRVCASLCRLLEDPARRVATLLALADAHVDAVRALAEGGLPDAKAVALCEELELRTAEVLAHHGG